MIRLTICTIAMAIVLAFVNVAFPFFQSFQLFSWLALFYFFLLTAITGYMGFRSLEKSPHGFVAGVNGIVLVKLMLSVGFLITYLVITKPGAPNFIFSFFAFYIVYTVFEVWLLVKAQRLKALDDKRKTNP